MHRILAVVSIAVVVGALLLGGEASMIAATDAATPVATSTAMHPLVGAWEIDTDTSNPSNPPGLAIVAADGTYIELHEREPDGAGIWNATGENSAELTIVFHSIDAELALEATVRVHAEVTVDASGDRFSAPYTIEFMTPDGTVVDAFEGMATGTRIGSQGFVPAASPVSS
jgi:hypothetical protein